MSKQKKFKVVTAPKTGTNLNTHVINKFKQAGHFAMRVNTTGVYDEGAKSWRRTGAKKGTFDVYALVMGTGFWLETKTQHDTPRPDQFKFAGEITSNGGFAYFVTDIEHFDTNMFDQLIKLAKSRAGL